MTSFFSLFSCKDIKHIYLISPGNCNLQLFLLICHSFCMPYNLNITLKFQYIDYGIQTNIFGHSFVLMENAKLQLPEN